MNPRVLDDSGFFLLFFVGMALGTLTKGPPGLAFPLVPGAAWKTSFTGFLLVIAIALGLGGWAMGYAYFRGTSPAVMVMVSLLALLSWEASFFSLSR